MKTTFVLWMLLASSFEALGQVPQLIGALRVVDSTGKPVGPVIDMGDYSPRPDDTVFTALKVDGARFRVSVTPSLLGPTGNTRVVFVSGDCSGTPLLEQDAIGGGARLFDQVAILGNNFSLYLIAPGGTFASYPILSARNFDDTCTSSVGTVTAIPAYKASDLRTYFVPPFSIQEVAPLVVGSVPAVSWESLAFVAVLVALMGFAVLRKFEARPGAQLK